MLARLARVLRSFLTVSAVAASPLKAITGIVISIILPYLLYAFLGGFGVALALVGIVWGVIWLAKRNES